MPNLSRWSPEALAILRIVTALLFLEHGLIKIVHFPVAMAGMPPNLPPILVVAGAIEIVGGVLLLFGFLTRVTAFICAGEMAAAYFMAHAPQAFWPAVNQGEPAIFYCFIFLFLVFAGPGAWSLDAMVGKSMKPATAS